MDAAPAFATVILDVDSTVSGIEGIDWLAAQRGQTLASKVASLTDEAMRGEIALEQVYGARLGLVRPRRNDIEALSRAYIGAVAPGCVDAVQRMRAAGVRVMLVSGGLRPAILPLATHVGVDAHDLHAVDVHFDSVGEYGGYDTASPLATAEGKRRLLEFLKPDRPSIAVGDGSTDLAMRPVVDRFVCFAGFVRRDSVAQQADTVVESFGELMALVFGGSGNR